MDFCKTFNARTQAQDGLIIPVVVTVYSDRSYTFITKTPPAAILLARAAGVREGLGRAEPQQGRQGHQASRSRRSRAPRCRTSTRPTSRRRSAPSRAPRVRWASKSRASRGAAQRAPLLTLGGRSSGRSNQKEGSMSQHGKKYRTAAGKVEVKAYPLADAVRVVTETAFAKFDETVEIAMRLGVDPKHADQMVRGTVVLPHGLGRTRARPGLRAGREDQGSGGRRCRFRGRRRHGQEDRRRLARLRGGGRHARHDAGGRSAGQGARAARPDAQSEDRDRHPDVAKAVQEIKAGKVEFRVDKTGIIHAPFGKRSFGADKLLENVEALVAAVVKAKPAAAKGKYVKYGDHLVDDGPWRPGRRSGAGRRRGVRSRSWH